MEALVLLAVLGALIVLPLLLLKALFSLVLGLVFLPFKLLGGLFRLGFGLVAGLLKVVFSGTLVIGGILLAVGAVVLLPLLPFVVLGGLVWLVVKASRPVTHTRTV
jgi:hypothetical protein